jgi:hypothetical protein
MILGKLKMYGMWVLGMLLAIVYALFRTEQAKRARESLERKKAALKITQQANKAMTDGLKREGEAERNAKDKARTGDRSHFDS